MTPAIETIQSPPYTRSAAAPAAAVAMMVAFLDHDLPVVAMLSICSRAVGRSMVLWV